ncbi:MAG: hypothetical protein WKG07_48205 [Hymenobacter sp.]
MSKYWDRYRQVLVTNLRQFAFVAEDAAGHLLVLDSFELARTEADFWALCHAPTPPAPALAAGFAAFFERCLRHAAPLDEPKDLAWFLAALPARPGQRLGSRRPRPLAALCARPWKKPWASALRARRGARFLRATVVQTLFYGVFSAWVLWHRDTSPDNVNFTKFTGGGGGD